MKEETMDYVRKYLSKMELGERTVFRNLTMFAIEGATDEALDYLTLADALRLEVAKVSEISDGGSVPELLFENSADLPVLILDAARKDHQNPGFVRRGGAVAARRVTP
jgi:hypothetical protein